MLFCGLTNNHRMEMALKYLPDNIYENINGKVAFIMLNCDACRLTSIILEYKEIILFSPWIFPYKPIPENDKKIRYFIFCVLHEVAHVILKHKSPSNCSIQENERQENEADDLALTWFNGYVSEKILSLSIEEIRAQQELNQTRVASFLSCG